MTEEITWHTTPGVADARHQSTNRIGTFNGFVGPPGSERGKWTWGVAGDEEAGSTPQWADTEEEAKARATARLQNYSRFMARRLSRVPAGV